MRPVLEPPQHSTAMGASAVSRTLRPGMIILMAKSTISCLECQWLSRKSRLTAWRPNSRFYHRKRKVACLMQLLIGPRWPSSIKKTKTMTMVDFKSELSQQNAKKHQLSKRKRVNKTPKSSKKMMFRIVTRMEKKKKMERRMSTMREMRKGRRAKTKNLHWWRRWVYLLISLET